MIQALQLILALSLLVVIHELGHFFFARLFHVRVEKFYMFFNPKFSLVRFKKVNGRMQFRFFSANVKPAVTEMIDEMTGEPKLDKKGNPVMRPMTDAELEALDEDDWRRYPDSTEWGIGWLPFGGYCAIAGMVDETKSATDLPSEPQPWEFRSKAAWQRLLIVLGGILVNFIAALALFGVILFNWGSDKLPLRNVHTGLYFSEVLLDEGFQQQDKILSIDGEKTDDSEVIDIVQWLIIEGKRNVTVQRGTDTVSLTMSEDLGERYLAIQNKHEYQQRELERQDPNYRKTTYVLLSEFIPVIIDSVPPIDAMSELRAGDQILSLDSVQTPCIVLFSRQLRACSGKMVPVEVLRGEDTISFTLVNDSNFVNNLYCQSPADMFEVEHTEYSFLQSIPAGISYGWKMLDKYIKQFRLVFTPEGAQSLGGFGAIGSMFPKVWVWYSFWFLTAFLSLILAFMNFLPIPALDGGYILFLLVEIITRRKPSDRFLEIANNIGFWLLLALLIFANGNDILKLFF